jgi:type IV secretion system protein VirB1
MIVELALFMQLAARCAPTVAPETLAGIARTESGLNPYAILDNDTRRSYSPATLNEAQAIASQLIASGHSVDVGLMQVNNRNFPRLGLTVGKALDPCSSLSAGARVMAEAYSGGATEAEQQLAVRVALSRYNTGNPARGFANGYVRKVETSTGYLVPALKVQAGESRAGDNAIATVTLLAKPRGWDVWQEDDNAQAAVPTWDASPDQRDATVALPPAPPDLPRSAQSRLVMLQPALTEEKQ